MDNCFFQHGQIFQIVCEMNSWFPGRNQDFSKGGGGGGGTVCQSEGSHQIIMSFSPPVVGCLLIKSSQKGGHRHPRTPLRTTPVDFTQGRVSSLKLSLRYLCSLWSILVQR